MRVFAGGYVTGATLCKWGYATRGECVHCGVDDTLEHRVLWCPFVDEVDRMRYLTEPVLRKARDDLLFRTRLLRFQFREPQPSFEAPSTFKLVYRKTNDAEPISVDKIHEWVHEEVCRCVC